MFYHDCRIFFILSELYIAIVPVDDMVQPLKIFAQATIAPLLWSMICFFCGIVVWLGALLMFGYGVAPVLFKLLPSRDLAGLVNTEILLRLQTLEHLAAVLIIVGVLMFSYQSRAVVRIRWITFSLVLVLSLAGMLFWYAHIITPFMRDIQQSISSFDRPALLDEPLIAVFRSSHQLYSRLVIAQMIVLILLLFWQIALFIHVQFQADIPRKPENLKMLS